jgi:hypothetical protein
MYKKVLSETGVYFDKLPNISHVNNNEIKNSILYDFYNFKITEDNFYKDIKINMHPHITWVMDYMRDHVKLKYGFTLIPINFYAQIHSKDETTLKRNHIDLLNTNNLSDFTYMYFVEASEEDELIIEWENYKSKENFLKIPVKTGEFVMWNSNLNYYLLPNQKNSFRIILLFNCGIL